MKKIVSDKGGFWLGTTLAMGAIISTLIASGMVLEIKTSDRTISVKGYAVEPIVADFASWSGEFTVRGANLKDLARLVDEQKEIVTAHLKESKINTGDTEWKSPEMSVLYKRNEKGNDTHNIESYKIKQRFIVQSRNVNLIAQLAEGAGKLLESGLEFNSHRPSFRFTKLEKWKLSMLEKARTNARERADILVKGGGVKIGDVRSASQGIFQIKPWNDTSVSSYGTNDTSAISKNICAVVTMEYAFE